MTSTPERIIDQELEYNRYLTVENFWNKTLGAPESDSSDQEPQEDPSDAETPLPTAVLETMLNREFLFPPW